MTNCTSVQECPCLQIDDLIPNSVICLNLLMTYVIFQMLQLSKEKLYTTTGRLILCSSPTSRQELLSFLTHSSLKLLLFGILSLFLSFHPPLSILLNWVSGSLLSNFLFFLYCLNACFSYIFAIRSCQPLHIIHYKQKLLLPSYQVVITH